VDVADWLRRLGFEEYVAAFIDNRIDAVVPRQLSDGDLKALGVAALGDRKKLLAAISALVPGDAEAPEESRAPLACTPNHLAERILRSRGAVEGERKHVTVLFADIRGSLELIESSDPEQAHRLLDSAIGAMMDAVHRYEGTVNKVLGDGIMALFGAPPAHEDHAVRACYAALAMQDAVRRAAKQARPEFGVEPLIRVGLNSGEVVVRAIGNDLSMDYDAIGPTTHLAGRMEQLAVPGTIRLAYNTLRLAEAFVRVNPLGPVPVKGLEQPIEVYELEGAMPTRSRFQAALARGLSRFVGRDNELAALGRALARAVAGHGQVFAVVGEAGVGKSRLSYEFTHSHRVKGMLILENRSVSYGKATPYFPVIDLLKTYFDIEDRDDARRVREKVTGKVLTLDQGLRPALPALLGLLDVPAEDPQWDALEPAQRRRRTLEAVRALLLRESRVQPLVVMFEDLHWIDGESQAFLDGFVDSLPTAPVLLMVNYRPEYRHGWANKTYYTRMRIDPLTPESAGELLDGLLGTEPELVPLKRRLIARTEGNPFFVEESVRTLVESGAKAAARSAYREAAAGLGIGQAMVVQGDLAQAIPVLERAVGLCEVWDLGVIYPTTAAVLGLAHALCGRVAAALPLIKADRAPASAVRIFDTSTARTALATGCLLAGRIDDAHGAATRTAEFAEARGFRGSRAPAWQLPGEIAARREPPQSDRAEDHYRRALALADEFGMRPLVAHCHLGLGRLRRCAGDRQEADAHVATATTMYRDMDMRFWLERAIAAADGQAIAAGSSN